MQRFEPVEKITPLLTAVDFQQSLPAVPTSDADLDFNAEPNGIPLSETKMHTPVAIFHQNPEIQEFKQEIAEKKSDVLEIKAITEDQLQSTPELLSVALSEQNILLYTFLSPAAINHSDIQQAGISETHLLKLFRKETGCFSVFQWSSLDHLVEKSLQWPLLRPKDVGESAPQSCISRVRPHGRSILLTSFWGLMKTYGARGFAKGVETGLAKSVHYFIYAMLAYRFVNWVQPGVSNFQGLQDLFSNSNQKGIDSLVTALAKLQARWLKLILVSPLIIGFMQSMVGLVNARKVSPLKLQQIINDINHRLLKPSSVCRDSISENLLPFAQTGSLSSQVQKLEQLVRWDGRLSVDDRRKSFECIRYAAQQAHQVAQLNVMDSLAKISQGIGFKDLPRLQAAGYSKATLLEIIRAKTLAFSDLENLSQLTGLSWKIKIASAPRRVYASYLLWWLGLSTSFWKQRLPFFVFKAVKLAAEIYFLQKIAESIIAAIHCPDKPGFQFGDGYQPWASDYTSQCFTAKIKSFRTLDENESVDTLVAEIPQYHLTDLNILNLSSKYLTDDEAYKIIRALVQQGVPLQQLDLSYNQLSSLNDGIFVGLNQLQTLILGGHQLHSLSDRIFANLSQLQSLDLSSSTLGSLSSGTFVSLSQLQSLDLSFSGLSSLGDGLFIGLNQLQTLYLTGNQLSILNDGLFADLVQLQLLDLSYSRQLSNLSNGTFAGLSQLKSLDLSFSALSSLSDGLFAGLGQLQTLSLADNQLSTLSDELFADLTQLQKLSLYENYFNSLSKGLFANLVHLQKLDLFFNMINATALLNMLAFLPTTLVNLDISSNDITSLPENFSQQLPASIQQLSIGNNSFIPSVLTPEFMRYFPSTLTAFGIGGSGLVSITENTFSNFSLLKYLALNDNQLSNLSSGLFAGLSQLQELYLDFNHLNSLNDDLFIGLSQLQVLSLWENNLNSLSDMVFTNLNQLQILNLDSNQLTSVSNGVFRKLSQLQELGLSNNQLSNLDNGLFSELSQLQRLALWQNNLSSLSEGVFAGLRQLVQLFLEYNELDDFAIKNMTIDFPYQLNYLSLGYNHISDVQPLAEILGCTNLTYLWLDGNPINNTLIALEIQQKNLRKFCDDQRCHANLPATEACSISQISASKITGETVNTIKLNSPALPGSNFSSKPADFLLTPASTAGVMIVSVMGFGLLLYKNAAIVRAVVNTGYHLLQRCFYRNPVKQPTSSIVKVKHCQQSSNSRCLFVSSKIPTVTPDLSVQYSASKL